LVDALGLGSKVAPTPGGTASSSHDALKRSPTVSEALYALSHSLAQLAETLNASNTESAGADYVGLSSPITDGNNPVDGHGNANPDSGVTEPEKRPFTSRKTKMKP